MNQDFDPLEKIVHGELNRLAPIKAPPELSRAVLDRIRAGPPLAWWQQSIWNWPPLARGAFLFVAIMLVLCVSGGSWVVGPEVETSLQGTADKFSGLGALWSVVLAIGSWLMTVWQHSLQPSLPYLVGAVIAAYVLCLALGTAVVRYAVRHS